MNVKEIAFLDLEELFAIHELIAGEASAQNGGVKEGLLRACLSMPANKIGGQYVHQDIFEMAGAYLIQITNQKPFKSHNARTAALASLFFLYLHGLILKARPGDYAAFVSEVAGGKSTINQASKFFRKNCTRDLES